MHGDLDSGGIQAFLEIRRIALETGATLTLAAVPKIVSGALKFAGVERFFTTHFSEG